MIIKFKQNGDRNFKVARINGRVELNRLMQGKLRDARVKIVQDQDDGTLRTRAPANKAMQMICGVQ